MNSNYEIPVSQENLTEIFNNRAEKLFEHLDDGKNVTYLMLSKAKLLFHLEGKRIKPSKFFLSFYSPDGSFHFYFDERKHPFEITDGCLQLLFEDEHLLVIAPNGKIYCSGYKRNNSSDFTLLYYFESGDVCNFYVNDSRCNFLIDIWNNTGGAVDFESLFNYLQPLATIKPTTEEPEEIFDETNPEFDFF